MKRSNAIINTFGCVVVATAIIFATYTMLHLRRARPAKNPQIAVPTVTEAPWQRLYTDERFCPSTGWEGLRRIELGLFMLGIESGFEPDSWEFSKQEGSEQFKRSELVKEYGEPDDPQADAWGPLVIRFDQNGDSTGWFGIRGWWVIAANSKDGAPITLEELKKVGQSMVEPSAGSNYTSNLPFEDPLAVTVLCGARCLKEHLRYVPNDKEVNNIMPESVDKSYRPNCNLHVFRNPNNPTNQFNNNIGLLINGQYVNATVPMQMWKSIAFGDKNWMVPEEVALTAPEGFTGGEKRLKEIAMEQGYIQSSEIAREVFKNEFTGAYGFLHKPSLSVPIMVDGSKILYYGRATRPGESAWKPLLLESIMKLMERMKK